MATESTGCEDSDKSKDKSPVTDTTPTTTETVIPTPTTTNTTAAATTTTTGPPVVPESTSNILFIRNLVRPFTLVRLKELLEKTGKLIEEQFWIDKIKSKCYATYENIEDAIKTRETLNGISWPDANPKKLIIEFATLDELEYHLNLDKNPPPSQSLSTSQSTVQPLSSSTTVTAKSPSSTRARTYSTKQENVNETKESSKRELNNEKFDAVIRRGKLDQGASKDLKEGNKQDRTDKSERERRPIREWDKEKFSHNEQKTTEETISPNKKKRATSASPEGKGRRNRDSQQHREKDRKHKDSEEDGGNIAPKDDNAGEHESPAKLLDDLYKKTKATPCIYWLPLDEDQAKKRAEVRAENLKKREEELAAREASRKNRLEKQQRQRRRTPPQYERRQERSPVTIKGREPTFNRRAGAGRGSYSGRRSQPSRLRERRSRSRSSSLSRSRSRSRSYSRSRTRSSSRSRSRSVARKRSRSRTSRSPRRNGAAYVRRSRSRSRSPPPKRMVSPRRR